MPAGGSVPSVQTGPRTDRARLEDFFASPFGVGLDDRDGRGLLECLLWFATDYGPGDPLRWSEVSVEILLLDWVPARSSRLPPTSPSCRTCCGPSSGFTHAEVGLRSELTDKTHAAINTWEPHYQQTIRSPRPQGPAALLAALGLDTDDVADMPVGPDNPEDFEQSMLGWLALDVGDRTGLDRLDDDPLPDEPFRGMASRMTSQHVSSKSSRSSIAAATKCSTSSTVLRADGYDRVASNEPEASVARVVRKRLPQRWSG